MPEDCQSLPGVEAELARRKHARLRLGIPARLETLDGRFQVRLVDLSQGGAHLVMPKPVSVRAGVLSWMQFQTFGETKWQEEEDLGLEFDRPLSPACLKATRDYAPEIFYDLARSFVEGTDGARR